MEAGDDCDNVDDAACWVFSVLVAAVYPSIRPFLHPAVAPTGVPPPPPGRPHLSSLCPRHYPGAFSCLSRLKIVKWDRAPPRFWRFWCESEALWRFNLDLQPALPPSARCQLAPRGHPSGGLRLLWNPPLNLLAPLVLLRPRKARESIEFIKGRWAVSSPGASGGPGSGSGLPCQLEKWHFAWMNHWSVQQEWGRIEPRPPPAARVFVLTVTKGRKESSPK